MINWPDAVAYLTSCPDSKAKAQLLRLAIGKCKVKPPRPKIRLPRGAKKETVPALKKELDRVFSIFIRTRDAYRENPEYAHCRTCNRYLPWRQMDAGHYRPRQDLATRWDEKNVHVQCKACNGFRGGEQEKMAKYIDLIYGRGTAEALKKMVLTHRITRDWLKGEIEYYKNEIGEAREAERE